MNVAARPELPPRILMIRAGGVGYKYCPSLPPPSSLLHSWYSCSVLPHSKFHEARNMISVLFSKKNTSPGDHVLGARCPFSPLSYLKTIKHEKKHRWAIVLNF